MITETQIEELAEHLVNTRHATRLGNQREDETYYKDTFGLPLIKDAQYIIRTGSPARLIDGIVEQIVTSNPQVYNDAKKDKAESREAASRIAKEQNRWATYLNKQNPNPYKQSLKHQLVRGDFFIYVVHNDALTGNWQEEYPNAIPVRYFVYDPLITFYDPDMGEEYGVPNRILIQYNRTILSIQNSYPDWKPKDSAANERREVQFRMYFDGEVRYMSAEGTPLLGGIQENIYHKVPFVHGYSGFGYESADKDPASLAVGRIRKIKDLYREDCTLRSDFSLIVHKYAYKHYDVINRSGERLSPDAFKGYSMAPGTISELFLPKASEFEVSKDLLPDQAVFNYYAMIRQDISAEDAPILHGLPTGSSGRQDDIALRSGMKLYDSVINNCAEAWATAFDMGIQMTNLPNMRPNGIKEGDVKEFCETRVELKSTDPLERDRLRALGERLYQNGEIDLYTNLTEYQGYTDDKARKIMARILADNVTRNSPMVAEAMGMQAVNEIGMEDQVNAIQERIAMQKKGLNPSPKIGSEGGEPRQGNIKTEMGREMVDMSTEARGIRQPPQPY